MSLEPLGYKYTKEHKTSQLTNRMSIASVKQLNQSKFDRKEGN